MILSFHKKRGEKESMQYEELLEKYKKAQIENMKLQVKCENLTLENNNLKRIIFGSKRETIHNGKNIENIEQCSLFEDPKQVEENLDKQINENIENITVYKKKNKRKTVAGIKKERLKDVEVELKEFTLPSDTVCPECESELQLVSKKIVRKEIKYVPAKFIITNYVQCVYKCKHCGNKDSNKETSTFLSTEVPKGLLPHSFASPSLASQVIYQKYYLGVPLYRQEKMWDDKGLVLPRNMMANWNIKIKEYYLENLYNLIHKNMIQQNEVLHCDETSMQCNKEEGRKATSNSYMWVLRSGEQEKQKGVFFQYAPSRAGEIAEQLTKDYKGILVTDGYDGYNNLENITHAECWAHVRRYFYESIPLLENKKMDTASDGYIGVTYCDKLFEIEREIALFEDAKKQQKREEQSKPILEEFFRWVQDTLDTKIIINSKLKKALTYAINQKKELSIFVTDGRIPLTNSLAERAIRPFAVHRKNWLFADSVSGAQANAVYYTLIESAKVNNLNIEKYIQYLLEEISQLEQSYDENVLEKYLPWSKELPKDILNYQGTYEELNLNKEEK